MNPLYLVIRSVKRSIWNLFELPREVKEFGWRFAVKDISLKICFNWTQSPQLFEKKHKNIFRWLEQNYPEELTKIENASLVYDPKPVRRIWVMWWQGVNNAPALVKKCVNILKQKSPDYEVTFLDKNNYQEYVQIPSYITDKFKGGVYLLLTIAMLSAWPYSINMAVIGLTVQYFCLMVGIRTIPIYHSSPLRTI